MRDDVTTPTMLAQLKRLANAFGKPFGTQAEAMGDEYAGAFRRAGIPALALEKAVDEAIANGKRFPPPAELLGRAREYVPVKDEPAYTGDLSVCEQCRMGFFYAGWQFPKSGLVLPRLRCGCGQTDDEWYTPAALAWTEPELDRHREWLKPRDYPGNPMYYTRKGTAKVTQTDNWQRVSPAA